MYCRTALEYREIKRSRRSQFACGDVVPRIAEESDPITDSPSTIGNMMPSTGLVFTILILFTYVSSCASPQTKIGRAASDGNVDLLADLLDAGGDIEERDSRKRSLLGNAAAHGHLAAVETLISKGADVNATQEVGLRPIHLAVWLAHPEVVRVLVANGANVNDKGSYGTAPPPLQIASALGHKDIVEILIAHGADVSSRSRSRVSTPLVPTKRELWASSGWRTPLDEARANKHPAIAILLTEHGAEQATGHVLMLLPFADAPGSPGSGAFLAETLAGTLLDETTGYEMVAPARVKEEISRFRVAGEELTTTDYLQLGRSLGADIVITGKVTAWKDGNLFFMPVVSFEANCLSVEDSMITCSMSHSGDVFKAALPERKAALAAPDACRNAITAALARREF
jgi:hypothetical protein